MAERDPGLDDTVAPTSGAEPTLAAPVDVAAPTLALASGLDATLALVTGEAGRAAAALPVVDPTNYVRLREFARGGLGKISQARDVRTGRVVALKEMIGDADELARRFAREARVTANLMHPAIVPVYELGRWPSGEPFFAMKLVEGGSLQEAIEAETTLAGRLARLSDIVAVADALAYAHDRGVIHRDLKPANVLVGKFGETVVIDWGLAKELGADDVATGTVDVVDVGAPAGDGTLDGDVLGTPSYMPPEQAAGVPADQRADVYAIGALLYQLVAGAAPYADLRPASVGHLLAMVKLRAPTPVEELEPAAPPELVAIIGKAMARGADDRYPTARELADDLRRFTAGQLVRAHHYDRRALLVRWLRRHRAAVTVGAALLAVLVVGAAISVNRIIAERDTADREARDAEQARDDARGQTARARESLALALVQKGRAAEQQRKYGPAALFYAGARVQHDTAEARWAAGLAEARAIVPALRFAQHRASIEGAAIAPASDRVATVDADGVLRVWSLADGRELASHKATHGLSAVAFAPDGRELAVGAQDGTIVRYAPDLQPVGELRHGDQRIWSLHYAPDGARLASGSDDHTVRVTTLATGATTALAGHTQRVYSVAFSPDGAELASGSDDRRALVWNLATGASRQLGTHTIGGIRVVAYPSHGRYVLSTGWDWGIHLWAAEGAPVGWTADHSVHAAAIGRDDRVIATAGDSPFVSLWEASTQRLVAALDTGRQRTNAVAFSRDGRWLVVAGRDRIAVVWDLDALPRLLDAVGHASLVDSLRISRDDTRLVSGSGDSTVRVWDAATGTELLQVSIGAGCIDSPQLVGDRLFAACDDQALREYDRRGALVKKTPLPLRMSFAAATPDGARLVGGHMKGEVISVDLASGAIGPTVKLHDHQIYAMHFADDGTLLSAGLDNKAKVWSDKLELRHTFTASTVEGLLAAAISADGRVVITGSQDGLVDAWRLPSGEHVASFAAHSGTIWETALAPDGKLALTGADDGLLKLWDTQAWKLVATLDAAEGTVKSLAVSRDGRTAFAGYATGALIAWDLATHEARYRVGGRSREKGACSALGAQQWVDARHRAIIAGACSSAPEAYLARLAAHGHMQLDAGLEVVPAW
ncbi:MAG: serine/threonine protein kinase [Deltaproteobacteria bacterium]|nr:serine/threonine protein kinase [Deltaproteobacteria bacterium]